MLQNAYFLAKIGADTAENEHQFAEILPIVRRVAAPHPGWAGEQQGAAVRGPRRGAGRPRPSGPRPSLAASVPVWAWHGETPFQNRFTAFGKICKK